MRTERAYTHRRCQGETVVDGPEFQAMSDPLARMERTYCVHCEDDFPVTEFVWSDTGELISAYYARHSKNATPTDLFWASRPGLFCLALVGLIAGIVLGMLIGALTNWVAGIVFAVLFSLTGAIAGAVIAVTVVSRTIARRVCGVEDTRSLE